MNKLYAVKLGNCYIKDITNSIQRYEPWWDDWFIVTRKQHEAFLTSKKQAEELAEKVNGNLVEVEFTNL